ncbi:putative holin-like toxin [Lederbergia citri]|nr:putative holin-like toxin [Lederbergia citri]
MVTLYEAIVLMIMFSSLIVSVVAVVISRNKSGSACSSTYKLQGLRLR